MSLSTLRLRVPLIVAPMAGGPSSPQLVAATCESGALGFLGAAYLSPSQIIHQSEDIRRLTEKPFGINLFCPNPAFDPHTFPKEIIQRGKERLEPFLREMGAATPNLDPPFDEDFYRQFDAVLEARPAVLSFVFGALPEDCSRRAREKGILLIGKATCMEEVDKLSQSGGIDAVVLQGVEAGGHRGIFDHKAPDPNIKTHDLLNQCVSSPQYKDLYKIAAGGIMSAEDIRRALESGADAVQMGTAFLACEEAGTSAPYKRALLASEERKTRITRAYSGRLARGLIRPFMDEMEKEEILPFPIQNSLTKPLRAACLKNDTDKYMSLSGLGRRET
ncbi:putative oxidoreductase [Planoprotostelium fungivorum]|uniref:Putative oxidoreductase n=1 Tax=Planoprotostelium fungivorum TaxID=1890364 RepID=A0A2P6NPX3_9EUKA|nr:putative oxidoreductase [Planoprotostelium fungivorum]